MILIRRGNAKLKVTKSIMGYSDEFSYEKTTTTVFKETGVSGAEIFAKLYIFRTFLSLKRQTVLSKKKSKL